MIRVVCFAWFNKINHERYAIKLTVNVGNSVDFIMHKNLQPLVLCNFQHIFLTPEGDPVSLVAILSNALLCPLVTNLLLFS